MRQRVHRRHTPWTIRSTRGPALLFGALALAALSLAGPRFARAQGVAGEVLGVTIEPGAGTTRLTLRCSAPMRPEWRREGQRRILLELPGATATSLPAELPVDANGIRTLRPRRVAAGLRLELDVDRPLGVRIVSLPWARDVIFDIGPEEPANPPRVSARIPPRPAAPPSPEILPAPAPEPGTESPLRTAVPPDTREAPKGRRRRRRKPAPEAAPQPDTKPVPEPLRGKPDQGPAPAPDGSETSRVQDTGPRLVGVELKRVGARVKVIVRTTGPAQVSYGRIRGESARVFIDVRGVFLGTVEPPEVPEGTPVAGVRIAQNSAEPPVCRIVLDLRPGASPDRVAPAGRELALLVAPGGSPAPEPALAPPPPPRRAVIAIDAGHGGRDPGASGRRGITEKQVTLDVALRVAAYLRSRGHEVRLSRTSDSTLLPPQRAAWVRENSSDLLVSIHCDSVAGRPERSGTTSYFHQGHSPSRALAELIQERLVRAIRAVDMGVRSDYTRYENGFYILRCAARPAVLVETGYISHAATAALFSTAQHRQKMAEGIASGILQYLERYGTGKASARAR